jgi:hypothetical protein
LEQKIQQRGIVPMKAVEPAHQPRPSQTNLFAMLHQFVNCGHVSDSGSLAMARDG